MTIAQELERKGLKRGIRLGKQEGIQEGIQLGERKGKLEGKLEVARSLLKMGLPLETIQQATGLTAEELAAIRH